jgi:hypothetical protein
MFRIFSSGTSEMSARTRGDTRGDDNDMDFNYTDDGVAGDAAVSTTTANRLSHHSTTSTISPRVAAPASDTNTTESIVYNAIELAMSESATELSDAVRRGVLAGADDAVARMRVKLQEEIDKARVGDRDSILTALAALLVDNNRATVSSAPASSAAKAKTVTAATSSVASNSNSSPPPPPVHAYFVSWDRRDGIKPECERTLQQIDGDAKSSGLQHAVIVCWSHLAPPAVDRARLRNRFPSLRLFFVSNDEISVSTSNCSQDFFDLNEWLVSRGLPRLDQLSHD